jgi:hypothetical protein
MIIDEAEEDDEDNEDDVGDLRISSSPSRHNSTSMITAPSTIAAEILDNNTDITPTEAAALKKVVSDPEIPSSSGGVTRAVSGGGSGQPRLRKTVVVTEDHPSVDLFKEHLHISENNNGFRSSANHFNEGNDDQNTEGGESSSMKDAKEAGFASRRHVLVDDIQDHLEKPNTLVIFLQLPTLSVPSSSVSSSVALEENRSEKLTTIADENSTKSVGKTSKLMIEFEYDLLNDNLIEIVDEMLQLEEFQSNPAITRDLMMNIILPVITYANQAITEQEQRLQERSLEGEGNNNGTSLIPTSTSNAAIEKLLSSSSGSYVSYYLLRQKYQRKGSSFSSSSSAVLKEGMNGSSAPSTPQKQLKSSESSLSEDVKLMESPKTTHRLNLHPTSIERNNSDDVILTSDQSSSSSQSQSISIPSSPLKYTKLGMLRQSWLYFSFSHLDLFAVCYCFFV